MWMKCLSIALLIVGEAFCVYSEMMAAHNHSHGNGTALEIFSKNFAWMGLAGAMLIAGYMIGYVSFKNIWLISVVSVTSILILEPLLTYWIFQEMPGRGASIGLVLGAAGFLATLLL